MEGTMCYSSCESCYECFHALSEQDLCCKTPRPHHLPQHPPCSSLFRTVNWPLAQNVTKYIQKTTSCCKCTVLVNFFTKYETILWLVASEDLTESWLKGNEARESKKPPNHTALGDFWVAMQKLFSSDNPGQKSGSWSSHSYEVLMYSTSHKAHNWVKTVPCPQRPVWLIHRNKLWPCFEKWVGPDEPHGSLSTWYSPFYELLRDDRNNGFRSWKETCLHEKTCFLTCQNKTRRQWTDSSALWSNSPISYSCSVAISLQLAAMVQSQEACHWSNLLSPLQPRAILVGQPWKETSTTTPPYLPLWATLVVILPSSPRSQPGTSTSQNLSARRISSWKKSKAISIFYVDKAGFCPKGPSSVWQTRCMENTHWDTASSGEEINSQPAQSTWQNSRDGRLLSKVGGESPRRADSLPPKHSCRKPVICVLWG